MTSTRRLLTVGGAVVLSTLIGATAYAAIPSAGTGVFNGCVNKRTGILRVIDPAAGGRCSTIRGLEETPIQWNVTGPTGPAGPAGPPGPTAPVTAAGLTNTRTTTATVTSSTAAPVVASCDPGDTPVSGYWTANGTPGPGNQAVFYSLGETRETPTGYQVVVGRENFLGNNSGPAPVVVATVVCLDTA